MHRLRTARHLARLVLVWFALSIGAAIASPLIKPQAMELICTGAGEMRLLIKSADGGEQASMSLLDCPLCTSLAPPPVGHLEVQAAPALARAVQSIPSARIAALLAAPLPARGPPL
ncbi:MAG: DUF2946 domain-containing protein [Burkholderiaceae bacterium]|nr:DUF2946 domain-containing protein [Burkholderiaceae bacterium]